MLLMPGHSSIRRTDSAFLSKYAALFEMLQRIGDLGILLATAVACHRIRFGTPEINASLVNLLVVAMLLVLLVFPVFGLYRSWRGEGLIEEVGRIALAWTVVIAITAIIGWGLADMGRPSREWGIAWYLSTIVALGAQRGLVRFALRRIRSRGLDSRDVVIIGATRTGHDIAQTMSRNAWMGLRVVGHVRTPYDQVVIDDGKDLGDTDAFIASLRERIPSQIWIALPLRAEDLIQKVMDATADLPITLRLVPDLFGFDLLNHGVTSIGNIPVITLQGKRLEGRGQAIKAIEDVVLGGLILILIAPLMALIAIGVKLSSPGPVLFGQRRHGLGGEVVDVWKFRSMRVHQEQHGQVTQATRGDSRITPFGRFLRASSLDELPQFINVIQGHMSIVGPRPHAVAHNEHYRDLVPRYMARHSMKPGITGWAQVNGFRGETDTLDKMVKRVEYDIHYIQNWSVWFDLRIIGLTIVRVFFQRSAY